MFKQIILSGAVASILATGAMAEDYMKDIYASIGSQGSYELGFAMNHSSNISSNWNKGIIPFVTVGVGADKIQGETEKSVFVKLHYAF